MKFTDRQAEILVNSYLLSLKNAGQVVEDDAVVDACRLANAGWLTGRVEENGDISWWWTPQAEGALRLRALMDDHNPN